MNEAAALHPESIETTRSLMLGVECWTLDNGTPIRSAAVPALDELDARLGSEVADRACMARRASDTCLPVLHTTDANVLAVAMPLLDRGKVTAVTLLYFDVADPARGAVEVWTGKAGRTELCLTDGAYPGLARFARLSPHVCFPRGSGLPGLAWETGLPRLSGNLGRDPDFLRRGSAQSEQLTSALAMPITHGAALQGVLMMLNHERTPLCRAVELWQPVQRDQSLRLTCGPRVYHGCEAVADAARHLDLPAGDGWIGRAWATRRVEMVSAAGMDLRRSEAETDGLIGGVAIPVIVLDDVRAVVVLMW